MGKRSLHRSIHIYLSKLKKPAIYFPETPKSGSAITSRILSACKYPKTPSLAHDGGAADNPNGSDLAATLSDVDRFLQENFSSLYPAAGDDSAVADAECSPNPSSPRLAADIPLDVVKRSPRFFVSPSTSNSLVEEARPSSTVTPTSPSQESTNESVEVPGGGVAVTTFSNDPYEAFRRSMHDMVKARHTDPKQPLDWDFMEELLFCYLELNERSVHRYILRAFTDLAVTFRRSDEAKPRRRQVPLARKTRRRGRASTDRHQAAVSQFYVQRSQLAPQKMETDRFAFAK